MLRPFTTALLALTLLGGCALKPSQGTSRAVQTSSSPASWVELASKVATQTEGLTKSETGTGKAIFILPVEQPTPFSQAFSELLATELVQNGVTVTENRSNALFLKFNSVVLSPREVLVNVSLLDGYRIIQRNSLLLDTGDQGTRFFSGQASMKVQGR